MQLSRKKLESIAYSFRRRFLKCKSPNDIDKLRGKLFNLSLGENVKEKIWDAACLGESLKKKGRNIKIPLEEIVKLREKGWFLKEIAEEFDVSDTTIRNRLKNYRRKEDGKSKRKVKV